MKKENKKKLEHELMIAMETILIRHNSKGIDKTKKAIKLASKAVAKKFNKVLKGLEEKKPIAVKAKKKTPQKTEGAKRGRPRKITLNPAPVDSFTQPLTSVEGMDPNNQ